MTLDRSQEDRSNIGWAEEVQKAEHGRIYVRSLPDPPIMFRAILKKNP